LGVTQMIPRVCGIDKAFDLLATGRTYGAEEAEKLGVITRCVEDEALIPEAEKLAGKILKNAPYCIAALKDCIYKTMELPLSEGLVYEGKACAPLFGQPDQKEGMTAFLEKRKANLTKTF
ncbi:MAG: hypothetical protein IJL97_01580, partial [Lachnospiraceae bacterium]|nr:hypothetical protein [Lachnospiraceae bacterium]